MNYRRLTMKLFLNILRDFKLDFNKINVIADIGAHDGADSIELLEQLPHAICYAVEGLRENYLKYYESLENKNIKFFNIVMSNYNGIINFYEKK